MNAEVAKKDIVPKDDIPLQVRLGTAIRRHRQQMGITQEELAWRADMHRTYVADIERGGRNVTLRSVAHLARALKVSVADLLSIGRLPTDGALGTSAIEPLGEILLVEDNAIDSELVVKAFKRAHLTNPVKVIGNGEEALDYLRRSVGPDATKGPRTQLVLLDLNLPGLSGTEVLRQIKSDPALRRIPVVILTASQHDRNIIECGRLGAENYIIKPVEFANFSRVASALNLHWNLVTGRPLRPSRAEKLI